MNDTILNAAEERLRDEFAMAALTGMLADEYFNYQNMSRDSAQCYEIADAMITARKK